MQIDTQAIRRLRDHLLANPGRADEGPTPPPPQSEDWNESAVTRRVEPFAETMFLVMMADGEPADRERQALLGALNVLTDGQVSSSQLSSMLDRFAATAASRGIDGRIAELGARLAGDQDERETAFTLAAAIALADERIDLLENRTLQLIREYYGISDRRMAVLLETID